MPGLARPTDSARGWYDEWSAGKEAPGGARCAAGASADRVRWIVNARATSGILAILLLGGCSGGAGGGGGPEQGTLSIEVTDAPLTHELVEEAWAAVDEVRVHQEAGASSGFLTLYSGEPRRLDLLHLRNGVTYALVRADLPRGTYRQVRLRFDDAYLRLVNGNEYTTQSGTLKLTSQATSGLKVFIEPPVEVPAGGLVTLLLDFDLSKTFRPTPASDPLNASSYKLGPVIRTANLSQSGEISGTITATPHGGSPQAVDKATIYVMPPGESDPDECIASTATESDGRYAAIGIPAGTWDVLAVHGTKSARSDARVVQIGGVTLVDMVVQ